MVIGIKAYGSWEDRAVGKKRTVKKEMCVSTKEEFVAAVAAMRDFWLSYVREDNDESVMYYDDALSLLPSA